MFVSTIEIRKVHDIPCVQKKSCTEKKPHFCLGFRETQTPKLRYKCDSVSNCKISSRAKKKLEKQKIYCLLCVRNVQVFFLHSDSDNYLFHLFIYFTFFLFFIWLTDVTDRWTAALTRAHILQQTRIDEYNIKFFTFFFLDNFYFKNFFIHSYIIKCFMRNEALR